MVEKQLTEKDEGDLFIASIKDAAFQILLTSDKLSGIDQMLFFEGVQFKRVDDGYDMTIDQRLARRYVEIRDALESAYRNQAYRTEALKSPKLGSRKRAVGDAIRKSPVLY